MTGMKPALFFESLDGGRVRCLLCPHFCILKKGQAGKCGVRKNAEGKLVSLNYDKIVAIHTDPIEKKPLYHFFPGSRSLSIAAMGCNLKCRFCQNHTLSMVGNEAEISGQSITPEKIVEAALDTGAGSISYTYTEPTVYFELMAETAAAAREAGIRNVMVSNGFIAEKPLEEIIPLMDGANIDLKSFSDHFYSVQCGGKLLPVLETIRFINRSRCWLEVTTLLIPGLNTDENETDRMIGFMADTGPEIPWHLSRFFPNYNASDIKPTETSVIEKALEKAGKAGMKYLYGGNFSSDHWEDTRCPDCGETIVSREGYSVGRINIIEGRCGHCSAPIPGVWN